MKQLIQIYRTSEMRVADVLIPTPQKGGALSVRFDSLTYLTNTLHGTQKHGHKLVIRAIAR